MTESLSQRVQAVLENKGAQTRYSLSSCLELNKLCFHLISHLCLQMFLLITAPVSCFSENIKRKEGLLKTFARYGTSPLPIRHCIVLLVLPGRMDKRDVS